MSEWERNKYENDATMNGGKKKQVREELKRRILRIKQVGTRNVEFRN
jgi:hypothetical protein